VANEGEDYCRPATLNDLKLVLKALNENSANTC
jgi:hypothetical protein